MLDPCSEDSPEEGEYTECHVTEGIGMNRGVFEHGRTTFDGLIDSVVGSEDMA